MNLNQLPASLLGLSDANRPIRLRLSSEQGVRDDMLLVKHVSGVETMCGGFEYSLLCVAAKAGLQLKQFNAMAVELQFVTDSGGIRSVCGIVAHAAEGKATAAWLHTSWSCATHWRNAATLKQNAAGTVRYYRDDGTERRDSITAFHRAYPDRRQRDQA